MAERDGGRRASGGSELITCGFFSPELREERKLHLEWNCEVQTPATGRVVVAMRLVRRKERDAARAIAMASASDRSHVSSALHDREMEPIMRVRATLGSLAIGVFHEDEGTDAPPSEYSSQRARVAHRRCLRARLVRRVEWLQRTGVHLVDVAAAVQRRSKKRRELAIVERMVDGIEREASLTREQERTSIRR